MSFDRSKYTLLFCVYIFICDFNIQAMDLQRILTQNIDSSKQPVLVDQYMDECKLKNLKCTQCSFRAKNSIGLKVHMTKMKHYQNENEK